MHPQSTFAGVVELAWNLQDILLCVSTKADLKQRLSSFRCFRSRILNSPSKSSPNTTSNLKSNFSNTISSIFKCSEIALMLEREGERIH